MDHISIAETTENERSPADEVKFSALKEEPIAYQSLENPRFSLRMSRNRWVHVEVRPNTKCVLSAEYFNKPKVCYPKFK